MHWLNFNGFINLFNIDTLTVNNINLFLKAIIFVVNIEYDRKTVCLYYMEERLAWKISTTQLFSFAN